MSKLYGGIRSDWLSLEGKKRKTMDEEVRNDRARRRGREEFQFLIRKEGGCVWLRGNKVVFDNL